MNSVLVAILPQWFVIGSAALVGLCTGSFLNVVVNRIPFALSIVKPRSRCPNCSVPIAWYDNIPIISYLTLRGKCRGCKQHISILYPTLELLTGVLFAVIVWLHGPTLRSLGELWFVSVMLSLVVIDARHHILPDRITFPSLTLAVALAMTRIPVLAELDPMLEVGPAGFSRWRAALLGAAILLFSAFALWLLDLLDSLLFSKYYQDDEEMSEEDSAVLDLQYARTNRFTQILGGSLALIWLLAVLIDSPRDPGLYEMLFGRMASAALAAVIAASILWFLRAGYYYLRGVEGMGLGDIKLMAINGAFLGWLPAIMVLLMASILGIVVGLIMARRSGEGLRTALPLGACIGAAAILATIFLDLGLYTWI